MRIDQDTRDLLERHAAEFGGGVQGLTGINLSSTTLFELKKSLFGGKGILFTRDALVEFGCDRGFSRLKDSKRQPWRELTSLETDGASTWTRWRFHGPVRDVELELEHYRGRNGLGAGQIFWYDPEEFPVRAALFYDTAAMILADSPMRSMYDGTAAAVRTLDEAVSAFEAGPLHSESVTLNNPFAAWSGMRDAFAAVVAGTMLASDRDAQEWQRVLSSLDLYYARVLARFLREIEEKSSSLMRESAILSLGDQFDRLTSLWYTRQIARLCFSARRGWETLDWTMGLLAPRPLQAGNRLSIRLKERSLYEEEIRRLGGTV
jgi:hypothetical protein